MTLRNSLKRMLSTSVTVVGLFAMMNVLVDCYHHNDNVIIDIKVVVNTSHVVNVVEDFYISFTIDSYVFQPDVHWLKFNFTSPKLLTLLEAMSPAILRIGGSPSEWLFFNIPFKVLDGLHLKPNAIVFTKKDIIDLVELTRSTENRLLFDLNLQLRYGHQWDPSNTMQLFEFCSQMGFGENMDWELGNEPEYDSSSGQMLLTDEQIAHDHVLLKDLLQYYPNLSKNMLVGPDVVGISPGSPGLKIIQAVANSTGDFLKAITFHHYYFEGGVGTYKDYLNPEYFSNLEVCIKLVKDTLKHSKYPHIPFWLGETSDAWHSGTENVSDRYVSGFLWMEKLGLSAQLGVDVVMRQTLYGHFYSLLDIDMNPNPDFWLSWLHKTLVGKQVFRVALVPNTADSTTRIYAHCTNVKRSSTYKPGAVTVFGLNINPVVAVSLFFTDELSNQNIDVYLLEPSGPDGLLSKSVTLNGNLLKMTSDVKMPDLIPVKVAPGNPVDLQPLTFGYFVFPNANIKSCQ